MLGNKNSPYVEMRLTRWRNQRSLYWRSLRAAEKYPPKFPPLYAAKNIRKKHKLYGRFLRIANTPMVLFRPKWWFLGHPDFLEVNRAYEREFGKPLDDETRAAHKAMRDAWAARMGYKK